MPFSFIIRFDVLQLLLYLNGIVSDLFFLFIDSLQSDKVPLQIFLFIIYIKKGLLNRVFCLWSQFLKSQICFRSYISKSQLTLLFFSLLYSRSRSYKSYQICSFSLKAYATFSYDSYISAIIWFIAQFFKEESSLAKIRQRSSFSQFNKSRAKLLSSIWSSLYVYITLSSLESLFMSYICSLQSMFYRLRMLISFINDILVLSNLDISSERYEISSFRSFYLLLFSLVSFLNKADSFSYFKANSLFLLKAIIRNFIISLKMHFILYTLLNLCSLSFAQRFIPRSMPSLLRSFNYPSIPYEKMIRS